MSNLGIGIGVILLSALALVAGATAQGQVVTISTSDGRQSCLYVDSIRIDNDGFTHWRSHICSMRREIEPQSYAVRCAQYLAGNMTYFHMVGREWVSEQLVPTSLAEHEARYVCSRR